MTPPLPTATVTLTLPQLNVILACLDGIDPDTVGYPIHAIANAGVPLAAAHRELADRHDELDLWTY